MAMPVMWLITHYWMRSHPLTIADSLQGKEPVSSKRHNLTEFEYQEPTVVFRNPSYTQLEKNMLRTRDFLHREYLIIEETIVLNTPSTNSERPIFHLLQMEPILRIAQMFQFMRFKNLCLRVLLRAVPQHYGFITIGEIPWYQDGDFWGADTLWTANPKVLTVTGQPSVEFKLPWVCATPWLPGPKEPAGVDAMDMSEMWTIFIRNSGISATDTLAPGTVEVEVYAHFEDVELSGPQFYALPTAVTKAKGQMQQVHDRAPIIEDAHFEERQLALGLHSNSAIMGLAGAAAGVATMSLPTLGNIWSATKEAFSAVRMYEQTKAKVTQQQGVVESTHGETALATNEGGGSLLDLIPDEHWLNPLEYGDTEMKHKIQDIIRLPQHVRVGFLGAADIYSFQVRPIIFNDDALITSYGYLAYFAQFFRRWRGSLKFLIHFTTSPFVTARVLVRLNWGSQDVTNNIGDMPGKVITIKGDHVETLVVPFVYDRSWQWTAAFTEGGPDPWLLLSCLTINSTGDVTPVVKYMMWMSAGDDFQFDSYQFPNQPLVPPTPKEKKVTADRKPLKKARGQMDVTAFFKNKFDDLPGLATPQGVKWETTVEDLLYRWSGRGDSSVYLDARVNSIMEAPYGNVQNFDRLCNLFLYNSGSIRRRIFFDPTSAIDARFILQSVNWPEAFDVNYASPCHAIAGTSTSKWSVLDFSVPFISTVEVDTSPDFHQIANDQCQVEANGSTTYDNIIDGWVKAGNNFQLFHLMPLPNITWWPWYVPPTPKPMK
jgi:hypothetical protein